MDSGRDDLGGIQRHSPSRDMVKEAKAHLKLRLVRDVKGDKSFCNFINGKRN